eukprot:3782239-Amphidinium_carterae.1
MDQQPAYREANVALRLTTPVTPKKSVGKGHAQCSACTPKKRKPIRSRSIEPDREEATGERRKQQREEEIMMASQPTLRQRPQQVWCRDCALGWLLQAPCVPRCTNANLGDSLEVGGNEISL